MLQFVFSVLAIILAFLFVFVVPDWGMWDNLFAVIAAVAGVIGVVNWRDKIGKWKSYFQSDTKLGAIILSLVVITHSVINQFGIDVPPDLLTLLTALITGLGAGELISGYRDIEE